MSICVGERGVNYISEGGVGLRFCWKPVMATGELERDSDREADGDRERARVRGGDSELDRLLRCLDELLLGDPERDLPLLASSFVSSSGDSLRNRRRKGLLTPFLPPVSGVESSGTSRGEGGGEISLKPCSISSSFFFLAAALFL